MEERGVKKSLSTLAVFCGSKFGSKAIYVQKAEELGSYLADQKVAVLYGGGMHGCMGKLALSVLNKGGSVTGIIPKFFTEEADYVPSSQREVVVPDMHTRKKMFFEQADAFVALPGGTGTMEELTEMVTWQQLGLHRKPIGLYNIDGYYNLFLEWLKHAMEEGFVSTPNHKVEDLLVISDNPKTFIDQLCVKCEKFQEKQ